MDVKENKFVCPRCNTKIKLHQKSCGYCLNYIPKRIWEVVENKRGLKNDR